MEIYYYFHIELQTMNNDPHSSGGERSVPILRPSPEHRKDIVLVN